MGREDLGRSPSGGTSLARRAAGLVGWCSDPTGLGRGDAATRLLPMLLQRWKNYCCYVSQNKREHGYADCWMSQRHTYDLWSQLFYSTCYNIENTSLLTTLSAYRTTWHLVAGEHPTRRKEAEKRRNFTFSLTLIAQRDSLVRDGGKN